VITGWKLYGSWRTECTTNIDIHHFITQNSSNSVSIVIRPWAGPPPLHSYRSRDFSPCYEAHSISGTCPVSHPVVPVLSQVVQWPRHSVGHSPLYSVKVKNAWSYNSTSHISREWCLIKHRSYLT
jgi:hypothetical protein